MKSKGLMNGYRLYKNYWVADEPPYLEKKLSARQAHDILKQGEGLMLRNIYDWDCHEKTSFWFVINDKPMRMENLPSKVRNMVRRALKTLDMHLATKDEMLINQNGGVRCLCLIVQALSLYHLRTQIRTRMAEMGRKHFF